MGAIHSTKIPTGPTGKSGPPQKVDPFFRKFSGWTELIHWVLDRNFRKFWLNGSRPVIYSLLVELGFRISIVSGNKLTPICGQERIKLELYSLFLWIITCFYIKFLPWIPTWMYFTGTSSPTSLLLFPVTCRQRVYFGSLRPGSFSTSVFFFLTKIFVKIETVLVSSTDRLVAFRARVSLF